MKQVRLRYTKEFKIKAVELAKQNGSLQAVVEQIRNKKRSQIFNF